MATWPIPLAAAGGTVLAHSGAYLVGHPSAAERSADLARTGHGYWPVAIGVAFAALLTALALQAGRSARRSWTQLSLRGAWIRLAAVQLGALAAVELAERVAHGAPVQQLLAEPALLAAIPVVAAVSCLLVFVLRTTARMAEGLASLGYRRKATDEDRVHAPGDIARPARQHRLTRKRAPPSAAIA